MNHADHHFTLSVDIADQVDYTALVLLHSYLEYPPSKGDTFGEDQPKPVRQHVLAHIERWRQVGYPEQVRRIVERYREVCDNVARQNLSRPQTTLVVDATGVGRAILQDLGEAKLRPRGVVITGGGSASTNREGISTVPKQTLATVLQVVLQSQRLHLADDLPLDDVLYRELHGFRVKVSLAGHASYGNDVGRWREAPHDDIVLATAIGLWIAEHPNRANLADLRRAAGLT